MRRFLKRLFSSFTLRAWLWLLTVAWLYAVAVVNDLPSTHLLWASFAAVLIICLLLSRAALSGLSVRVRLPEGRPVAGSTLPLDVELRNEGSFTKSGVLLEWEAKNETFDLCITPRPASEGESLPRILRLEAPGARNMARFLLPTVPPGARVEASIPLEVTLRGLWRIKGTRLIGGDPLGLFRVVREVGFKASFVVLPRHDLYRWVDEEASAMAMGVAAVRLPGAGDEFHSLRPYEPGDDLKKVHWRATAKVGRLVVKTFERGREEQRLVVLDLREEFEWGRPPRSGEERKVEVTASLLHETTRRGGHFALAIVGKGTVLLPMEAGRGHFLSALEALALSRPGRGSLREATLRGLALCPRGASFVLVTSAYDDEVLNAIEGARARGMAVSCVLVPPPEGSEHSLRCEALATTLVEGGCPVIVVREGQG